MVRAESEGFAIFFIGEYMSMIMMATVTRLLFMGGTAAPLNLFFLNWLNWLHLPLPEADGGTAAVKGVDVQRWSVHWALRG
jgi:hypothetical protein